MIILKDEGSIDLVKHLTVLLSQLDLMECNYKLSITPCSVSNIRQGYNNGLVKMEQIVKLDKMKTSCYQTCSHHQTERVKRNQICISS